MDQIFAAAGGPRTAALATRSMRRLVSAIAVVVLMATSAIAQTQTPATIAADDWKVNIYPVFAWVPLGIAIDVNLPGLGNGGDGSGSGGSGSGSASIVDGRFDGAFLGGVSVAKGRARFDADGLWAAVGGDRPERPALRVDVDVIYFHAAGGVKVVKDLYLTGGVRRLALKYNVALADLPDVERKPGLWDPVLGLGWHAYGEKVEWHAGVEGGGFGVGSDAEFAGAVRLDWKPVTHFGVTAGYNYLYFKVSSDVANRTFTAKTTLHGPIVGIGLYF